MSFMTYSFKYSKFYVFILLWCTMDLIIHCILKKHGLSMSWSSNLKKKKKWRNLNFECLIIWTISLFLKLKRETIILLLFKHKNLLCSIISWQVLMMFCMQCQYVVYPPKGPCPPSPEELWEMGHDDNNHWACCLTMMVVIFHIIMLFATCGVLINYWNLLKL